jgi:UDP:flavonoid glycosyltransferase YjiC (YdhE family)
MRIVLNTFGSFGDVHPYLAIALELKRRRHDPLVATAEVYRSKIESAAIAFAPVAPDIGELLAKPEMIERIWRPRTGPDFLVRQYLLPALDQSFEDLFRACRGADLFLSHAAGYAGPIVAEMMKLQWLSVALQPMIFLSAFDLPTIAGIPLLNSLYEMSGGAGRLALRFAKSLAAGWAKPIHALRKRAGLPESNKHPMFEGQFSPYGTLALFSHYFAAPQRDWPPHTHVTGFPFYDQPGFETNSTELARFLDEGPPPVLFTLGSSAVMQPESFYEESLKAAVQFGFRAILLVGMASPIRRAGSLPSNVYVTDYLPYSLVMPRCSAIVHQGGIGTTAQALRAGRPTVIVPWAYDQPDNAERARKLGVSQTLSRSGYNAGRAGRALQTVLDDRRGYGRRASAIADRISTEDGVAYACDVIEQTAIRTATQP